MSRRKGRSRLTPADVEEAMRLADELEIAELERRAIKMVREDSAFTWKLSTVFFAMLALVPRDMPQFAPFWGDGTKTGLVLGMLIGTLIVLIMRHDRIRLGWIIAIAHGLRKSADARKKEERASMPPA